MDDFQEIYKNNVNKIRDDIHDNRAMISRTLQKPQVANTELELLINKITL